MLSGCDRDDLPCHRPAPSRGFRPYTSRYPGFGGYGLSVPARGTRRAHTVWQGGNEGATDAFAAPTCLASMAALGAKSAATCSGR
jgi:hypothetical protein